MEKRIDNVGKAFQNVGTIMDNAGSFMSKTITAPILSVGTVSTKMAMDFEDSMAKVSTIADGTVPLEKLQNQILELSNSSGIASTEIANNVYDAISAGQKTGDAVNFVSNSTKLAKAGFTDANSALDILTTTLNAYGMEADQVGKVSDILIQTQNLGKTTVGELASSMGKIIPTAKSAGVGLEQVAAGYAIMTSNGIATAESTTYMNSMINELNKSGTKVSDTLKEKTGQSFKELMESGSSVADVMEILSGAAQESGLKFNDLWSSSEAGKAATVLLGDSAQKFNDVTKQMGDSTGATEAAAKKLETNSFSVQKTMNMVKNSGIELGTTVLEMVSPGIEKFSEKISQLSKWYSNLDSDQKKQIVKFAGIAAAAGPVLMGFGKITSGVGGLITNFGKVTGAISRLTGAKSGFGAISKLATGPVGIGIAAVAAGAVLIYKNWDRIGPIVSKIVDRFKEFGSKISPYVDKATEYLQKFGSFLSENLGPVFDKVFDIAGDAIVSFFEMAEDKIDALLGVFEGVITFMEGVFTGNWTKVWEGLKGIVSNTFGALPGIIKAPINSVIGIVNSAIDKIKSIHISIPSIAGIGGVEWSANIPKIPQLAKGTDNWQGGIAQVNEKGGEIIDLPQGTRVYPHDESVQMARQETKKSISITIAKLADSIIVREDADIDRIAEAIAKKLEQTQLNMA